MSNKIKLHLKNPTDSFDVSRCTLKDLIKLRQRVDELIPCKRFEETIERDHVFFTNKPVDLSQYPQIGEFIIHSTVKVSTYDRSEEPDRLTDWTFKGFVDIKSSEMWYESYEYDFELDECQVDMLLKESLDYGDWDDPITGKVLISVYCYYLRDNERGSGYYTILYKDGHVKDFEYDEKSTTTFDQMIKECDGGTEDDVNKPKISDGDEISEDDEEGDETKIVVKVGSL
jgi:hypothetical protein